MKDNNEGYSGLYLKNIVDWIINNDYERIALQLPDDMLIRGTSICKELSNRLPNREVFIIGDTKQGSCCVDEVNAEHYAAHCIIHFGHSCHTMPRRIPTYYCYNINNIEYNNNANTLYNEIIKWINNNNERKSDNNKYKVLLLWDTQDSDIEMSFGKELQNIDKLNNNIINVFVCKSCNKYIPSNNKCNKRKTKRNDNDDDTLPLCPSIEVFKSSGPLAKLMADSIIMNNKGVDEEEEEAKERNDVKYCCGREIININDDEYDNSNVDGEDIVIFIGDINTSSLWPRLLLNTKINNNCTLLSWDYSSLNSSSSMTFEMQRYRLIEEVKKGRKIGILFGSVDVPNQDQLLKRIKNELIDAGREVYIFNVGQSEPAKLANFPEIDCYVMLSCPESFIWDTNEYMTSIATPYELEVALGITEWGYYSLEYSDILSLKSPMPIADNALYVQTLDGELIDFENIRDRTDSEWLESLRPYDSRELPGSDTIIGESAAGGAARIEMGKDGVAGKYNDEPIIVPGRW